MSIILIVGQKKFVQDSRVLLFLVREGYEPLTATTREEGLAKLASSRATVAIIEHDPNEPVGLALLTEVRATYPECAVILATPGGQMQVAIETLRAGALDYLTLPLDLEQLRIALGRARERRRPQAIEPAAIILLEDHQPTRERLAHVLEKEGYRVWTGADGEEGERLLHQVRADVAIVDMRMPKKDGLTLLREAKRAGFDVEFIVVTGHGDEESVVQALRDGAINFLRKPFDLDQLLLATEKAIEHQRLRRSLAHRNRDVELMEELVVRLTKTLEIVVETPGQLGAGALEFLHKLVNALPLGIVVVRSDRRVLFANAHVVEKTGSTPARLSADWLELVGIRGVTEAALDDGLQRTLASRLGTIETIVLNKWSFLVLAPLTIVGPESSEHFVAVVIRGERTTPIHHGG